MHDTLDTVNKKQNKREQVEHRREENPRDLVLETSSRIKKKCRKRCGETVENIKFLVRDVADKKRSVTSLLV